jgi:monofunctional biosynthetic peptidoglycan transglycosylase
MLALAVLAGVALWQWWTWPNVARLARERPASTAFIDRWMAAERAAGRPGRPAWTWVAYDAISPHLKRAVLVAEDINFFSHRGFDKGALREALREAVEDGRLRGGSTITQQLAKNLWLSPSRDPLRKGKEAALTWQLERNLSKRRMLELYLNVVELGPGVYGAEGASRRYFGKRAADLDEDEAAQLAAALPRPRTWHPGSGSRAYRRYVEAIKVRMAKATFLYKQVQAPADPGAKERA